MRVAWILLLAAWLAGYSPGHIAAAPMSSGSSGNPPAGSSLFHDGAFVYVPTPTPEPDNPMFYRGSFKLAVNQAVAAQSSPTPSPSSTPVPPTVAAATPTLTPVPTQVAQDVAVAYSAAPIPTITPTPFVLGAEPDPNFYAGGFYLPPLTPNPIDEPDHYRGSVVEDPSGVLPTPSVNRDTLPEVPYLGTPVKGATPGTTYETLRPTYMEQSPLPAQGRAMYYNPGIMAAVYAYRLQNKEIRPCAECVGYVALLRAGDLGRKVWLRWADGNVEGPFLVIDVAARHHIPLLLSRNWVVDVDYQTALRHSMNCPVPVTVLSQAPYIAADSPSAQLKMPFR